MDYGLVQCFKNSIEVMEGDSWKVKMPSGKRFTTSQLLDSLEWEASLR